MVFRKTLVFVFVILFSSSIIARPYNEEEKEGIKLYKLGVESANIKQYEEAIKYFDQAIIKFPQITEAYISKGHILNILGKYEEALKVSDEVLKLDKILKTKGIKNKKISKSRALNLKSYSLYQLKKYQESLEYSNLALSYEDKYIPSLYIRGGSYAALGNYQLAIDDFDKTLELDPNNSANDETYLSRACPLYKLGRYEEALATCDKALEITDNPNNLPQIYSKKAMALNKLGRYEEALENANKALEVNAKDPLALSEKNLAKSKLKKDSWF